MHHWEDYRQGLGELRRIAPRRVLLTFDPARQSDFWLVRDYLPAIQELETGRCPSLAALVAALGGAPSGSVTSTSASAPRWTTHTGC